MTHAIQTALDDHLELARQYERLGDDNAARQLRAVANLLGVILQGGTPTTVLPAPEPKEETPGRFADLLNADDFYANVAGQALDTLDHTYGPSLNRQDVDHVVNRLEAAKLRLPGHFVVPGQNQTAEPERNHAHDH